MNNILKAIEQTDASNVNDLINNDDIFSVDVEEFKRQISGNVYKKQYAKYLLLKMEYLLGDNTVHLSGYKNISVEHILPQHPGKDSQWVQDFTEDERAYWTDKIANLVLISKRKNSSLSNLDFKQKKERYLKGHMDVFKGSKVFIDQKDEWTPKVLEERQRQMIDLLARRP